MALGNGVANGGNNRGRREGPGDQRQRGGAILASLHFGKIARTARIGQRGDRHQEGAFERLPEVQTPHTSASLGELHIFGSEGGAPLFF